MFAAVESTWLRSLISACVWVSSAIAWVCLSVSERFPSQFELNIMTAKISRTKKANAVVRAAIRSNPRKAGTQIVNA